MSASDLACISRELGSGLMPAKPADPDAFADKLFGGLVELFFGLAKQPDRPALAKRYCLPARATR
jgi:hypothetical protein